MSGANTINANGGSLTLDESTYTDPGGGHIPGGVVIVNSPGNRTVFTGVSWAYVDESTTATMDSLVIDNFVQGQFLDYHPVDTLTSVAGTEEALLTLAPDGTITELGTTTVDGLTLIGLEVPVVETVQNGSGQQSQTDSHIDLLIAPGPATTAFQISDLTLSSDGARGIVIGSEQACYRAGTRIRTPDGEVAIEDLRPGDRVLTVRGRKPVPRPVVWIGHRAVECAAHPRPWDVLPVRVQAHAFGRGRPARDLWLSPDHAVFADGVLVPIRYLVNGASVVQETAARVTYFHLELPAHDVVLAEGLPAESFLDTGNRTAFANGGTLVQATPEFARRVWDAEGCAPLVTGGEAVRRLRRHLIARLRGLGHRLTDDPRAAFVVDGAKARARRLGDGWTLALPRGARTLRLCSRTARPADFDAEAEDTRRLGVALQMLRLDGADVALSNARLGAGWHAPEEGMRWTDGAAEIAVAGARRVELRFATSLRYLDAREIKPAAAV